MPRKISVKQVANAIGIPVDEWPGNCHTIANKMLKAGVVKGKLRYGHWHGTIHPDSQFGGRAFTHHGWILSGDRIIDPTRWVFENVEPYIYNGPADDPDYDFGGNRLRKQMMRPLPDFDETQKSYEFPESFQTLIDQDRVSLGQVMWLANLRVSNEPSVVNNNKHQTERESNDRDKA